MEHVRFGRTGLRVSRLCLGTMTFGLQCDVAQSNAILDAAAAGGFFFLVSVVVFPLGGGRNTAGRTEQIVGDWLRGKRHDFVLATKCAGAMGRNPWTQGPSPIAGGGVSSTPRLPIIPPARTPATPPQLR